MRKKRWLSLLLSAAILLTLIPAHPVQAGYETGYRPEPGSGEITAHGVDLSTWQGHDVDFNKIKAQGYSFVILRAGYATTKDDTFEGNYARAKAAGLDVGVYLYSYADNAQEALEEAAACQQWLQDKLLEYPVYYDLEEPEKHGQMSVSELTALALTFMDEMAANGWLTGLYSSRSWFDSKYDLEKIMGTYECWIAQYFYSGTYDSYERYTENYGMWQYSASGTVDGVPGNVDMNIAFRDYPTICRQYGFNGYAANGETLWLQDGSIPTVHVIGEFMELGGRVFSTNGDLKAVNISILDGQGRIVTDVEVAPGSNRYELSALNNRLRANTLLTGRYILRVTARNAEEKRILLEQSLVVSQTGIRLDDARYPVNMVEAEHFAITGVLTGATPIRSLTVSIHDRYGSTVTAQTVNPDTLQYDLAALSDQLDFRGLPMGTYQYRISAENRLGTEYLLNASFNVWVRSDPITISGLELKEDYLPGELTALQGKVTSEKSYLRQVTAALYDYTGTRVAEAKINNRAKAVALAVLGRTMDLSELKAGSYRLEITALNDAGPKTLLAHTLRIVPDAISLCDFEPPVMLTEGDSFAFSGVVASDQTELQAVSLTVVDSRGVDMMRTAVLPMAQTFDLTRLNERIMLSSLEAGAYDLRLAAENGSGYEVLYEAPLYIVEHGDILSWDGQYYRPNDIVYSGGDTPWVWGTLTSAESKLSEVSVEICADGGQLVAKATRRIGQKQLLLTTMNERLKLSALSEGTYTYQLTASNASGTYVLVQDSFTLARCPHGNVRSGAVYAASCDSPGAVCDSRCLDCGAKVRDGLVLEMPAHSYADGQCSGCGKSTPKDFTLCTAADVPQADDWLVLAVCQDGIWFALNGDGVLEQIDAPVDGRITVPRTLVWRLRQRSFRGEEGYALVNADGRSIHLDADGMKIAYGGSHSILQIVKYGRDFEIIFCHGAEETLHLSDTGEFRIFVR